MNKIEKMIKSVVEREFPSDPFLYNEPITHSQIPIGHDNDRIDVRDLRDGSGKEYFMWGVSRWSNGDIVAE